VLRVEVGVLHSNDTDNCVLTLSDEKVKAGREDASSLTHAQKGASSSGVRWWDDDRAAFSIGKGRPEHAVALALCHLIWTELENGSSEFQSYTHTCFLLPHPPLSTSTKRDTTTRRDPETRQPEQSGVGTELTDKSISAKEYQNRDNSSSCS